MALRKPPLREVHAERGAKFTEFGGWDMPVEFDGIRAEHEAVRSSAGLFDVSHMGEIKVSGPDATELTNRLTSNDVAALGPGDAQYAAITSNDGQIIDDTVVYLLPDGETYLFVPNAGNDDRMHERWTDHRDEWGLDAVVENATDEYAMFALQGPDAVPVAAETTAASVADLPRFTAASTEVAGVDCLVARTGYTGEDGVELLLSESDARRVWTALADVTDDGARQARRVGPSRRRPSRRPAPSTPSGRPPPTTGVRRRPRPCSRYGRRDSRRRPPRSTRR